MKIKKYQVGGIYYTPFFRDSVTQNTSQTKTKNKTSEDKEEQLIEKNIMEVLKENGLPNDVDYFLSKANSFLNKSKGLSLFPENNKYDMSDLIQLHSYANKIKHYKELYTRANQQVISENAGSEVAITNSGQLYVYNPDEGVKTISTSTYHKNPKNYQILTNSDLIKLRETQPELAYNGSILNDLTSTVGMKSIIDYVKATIGSFGTTKSNSQFDRYTKKQQNQIEEGFEQLLGFGAPDGIYKVSTTEGKSDQGINMQLAVNYLYRTLPNNMKHVLRANAAANGLDPDKTEDVQQLLQLAVMEHTNHSIEQKQELSFDSSATKEAGIGTKGGQEKTQEQTYLEMIATGAVVKPTDIVISSSNLTSGLKLKAQQYGYPISKSGEQIGRGTMRDILDKGQIGQIVDKNSISYGNKPLSDNELDMIVYDGISTLNRAYLPIDENIKAATGKIVPDLDMAERFDKFVKWYNEGYGLTPNSIVMKMQELDLDLVYDETTGEWKCKKIHPFLILNGYASDKAVNLDDSSKWVYHVNSDEGNKIFDTYTKLINYGSDVKSKSKKRNNFSGGFFGIGDSDSMYKSAIFMPITDPGIATVTTNHQFTNKENYMDILNKREYAEEVENTRTQF